MQAILLAGTRDVAKSGAALGSVLQQFEQTLEQFKAESNRDLLQSEGCLTSEPMQKV